MDLPAPRLAREHVEAGPEVDFQLLDDRERPHPQQFQHGAEI
jgi:hypothetical protein